MRSLSRALTLPSLDLVGVGDSCFSSYNKNVGGVCVCVCVCGVVIKSRGKGVGGSNGPNHVSASAGTAQMVCLIYMVTAGVGEGHHVL